MTSAGSLVEDFKDVPSIIPLEQFDVGAFSKEKIREIFRTTRMPTAEAMVDEILLRAIKAGATDLHLEPAEGELRIRMGLEGMMKKLINLPKDVAESFTNVLMTRGNLNAFEKKKPQEGRFSITVAGHVFDVRISTVPVLWGERVALRMFPKNARVYHIEELGFSEENLSKVRSIIHRPTGLFLVSGPSSSGKTTTMYAAVADIQSPDKNILTVENPIECKLAFASQISTAGEKSLTVAEALRAILKQNPHVIMVGEVRDAETGMVAAEAALTGNLVLSTMLSGDAVGTIYRLLNLGVLPYWLASTLIGVAYQQLVRRVCDSCKEEYEPSAAEKATLNGDFKNQKKFCRGKGCEKCNNTGYKGRTSINEVLIVNEQMRDLIDQQASMEKLKEAAKAASFRRIFQDASEKVTAGITTIDEYNRAVG